MTRFHDSYLRTDRATQEPILRLRSQNGPSRAESWGMQMPQISDPGQCDPHQEWQPRDVAGAIEDVALPDYRIGRIKTTLDPAINVSFMTVDRIRVYERAGRVRISFNAPQTGYDPGEGHSKRLSAELLAVSDAEFFPLFRGRAFQIKSVLVAGARLIPAHLWLTENRLRATALVLGNNLTRGCFRIDRTRSFQLGEPRHRYLELFPSGDVSHRY